MKKFLSLVVIIMLAVCIVGCGKKEEKTGDEKLMEEYKKNDLVFKNVSISADGENSIITSTLTNTSDEDKQIGWVTLKVTYKGLAETEYTTEMLIYFGDKIEGNQTLQTTTMVDFNTNSITKVEYEFAQK